MFLRLPETGPWCGAAPLTRADLDPYLRLDTGGEKVQGRVLNPEGVVAAATVAVGKGTLFVPAAHG